MATNAATDPLSLQAERPYQRIALHIALELSPIIAAAIGLLLLILEPRLDDALGTDSLMGAEVTMFIFFWLSGLGWLDAGYTRMGSIVLLARGAVVSAMVMTVLVAFGQSDGTCKFTESCTNFGPLLMSLFVLAVASPVVSAFVLAATEIRAGQPEPNPPHP
jgi:hypothetical protein